MELNTVSRREVKSRLQISTLRSRVELTDSNCSRRGNSRLQISPLRSRVELTDSNCSRQEVKADYLWLGTRSPPISPRCHIEF
ncbi:hypothetical protein TNCV_4055241 [Trichonephila clavipes]|nr:hypothetical protein TNCV_4055241 [Trichonephila clavipes]